MALSHSPANDPKGITTPRLVVAGALLAGIIGSGAKLRDILSERIQPEVPSVLTEVEGVQGVMAIHQEAKDMCGVGKIRDNLNATANVKEWQASEMPSALTELGLVDESNGAAYDCAHISTEYIENRYNDKDDTWSRHKLTGTLQFSERNGDGAVWTLDRYDDSTATFSADRVLLEDAVLKVDRLTGQILGAENLGAAGEPSSDSNPIASTQ
jgi:hypothetical protein